MEWRDVGNGKISPEKGIENSMAEHMKRSILQGDTFTKFLEVSVIKERFNNILLTTNINRS